MSSDGALAAEEVDADQHAVEDLARGGLIPAFDRGEQRRLLAQVEVADGLVVLALGLMNRLGALGLAPGGLAAKLHERGIGEIGFLGHVQQIGNGQAQFLRRKRVVIAAHHRLLGHDRAGDDRVGHHRHRPDHVARRAQHHRWLAPPQRLDHCLTPGGGAVGIVATAGVGCFVSDNRAAGIREHEHQPPHARIFLRQRLERRPQLLRRPQGEPYLILFTYGIDYHSFML